MERNGIMTMEEIRAQYAGEWVLIEYVELDEDLQVVRGRVLAHAPSEEEILRKLRDLQDPRVPIAVEYLGQVSEDVVIIV